MGRGLEAGNTEAWKELGRLREAQTSDAARPLFCLLPGEHFSGHLAGFVLLCLTNLTVPPGLTLTTDLFQSRDCLCTMQMLLSVKGLFLIYTMV